MIGDNIDAVSNVNEAPAKFSWQGGDLRKSCVPHALEAGMEKSAPAPAKSAMVLDASAVRSMLILAAEGAFKLSDGEKENSFLTRLKEEQAGLAQALAAFPKVHQGIDCSLILRRAQQAVADLDETISREIIEQVDETMSTNLLIQKLQIVKDKAVEAGKSLTLLAAHAG
jgi:hypothetical protein